ncbi:MAG TPA: HAD-IIIC family phosphatase [Tahibacter sp.]|nr:HAD-IIIC family phosphatase [Tahibacter sp.]
MTVLTIRFLRNATIEGIERPLRKGLREAALDASLAFGGFATARAEVLAGDTTGDSITVLSLGLEQVGSGYGHVAWPVAEICDDIYDTVAAAVERVGGTLAINTVLAPPFDAWGLAESAEREKPAEIVGALNLRLRRLARENAGRVVLCDWERYARQLGEAATYDYRFWFSSGAPFAAPFLDLYARDIVRIARVVAGRPRKCLVLDCDNTLWGGVVGEDGLDGIALSSDTVPGKYYRQFQQCALDLRERGVVLAIASKNNEQDVLEVLDRHPDMLLRREHFAAWRINWNHKAQSLRELSEELSLGLDSFVFVDDSALEIELVRHALPQVGTRRLPERAEDIAYFLHRENPFESLVATREDRLRGDSYRQNRERLDARRASANIDEYLAGIGIRIVVSDCTPREAPRVAQLLQRTNQFNLTTQRHDLSAIERRLADPASLVLCVEVADRFGDFGLTGVLIADRSSAAATIDSLLLSCRVLGRDVEFALVSAALEIMRERWGTTRVDAAYVASGKNEQVADFWQRCGFTEVAASAARRDFVLDDVPAAIAGCQRSYIAVEVSPHEH